MYLASAIRQNALFLHKSKIVGYLIVAMSLEDATMVLIIYPKYYYYPIILITLFLARFIAGRFIKPISSIITSNDITKTT
jgi:hypothetical protein